MRLLALPDRTIRVRFEVDEAQLLDQLTSQLIDLLQSHSSTALDPDPLFASLEVGGSSETPEDPALARLFPNAHENEDEASMFRQVSEQGLLNRKLQDASEVANALGLPRIPDYLPESGDLEDSEPIEVMISGASFPAWLRHLTALRLAVAARIGLDQEEDHDRLLQDEDTRGTVLVFDWIAAIIESLLSVHEQAVHTPEPTG